MSDTPVWLGEEDVLRLLSLEDAIDILNDVYRLQAIGEAATMRRAHVRDGDAILHAVGGSIARAGVAGTKTWVYTPGGAEPLLILFSLQDGRRLAVIDAFALGQMRTAATTGLATRLLAREDAKSLALVGTGKQAFAQAQAVVAVRPIEEIRIVGRDPFRRNATAARLREELNVEVTEFGAVAAAVANADVVTTITRAAEPILHGDAISPGTHINAVGAIVPSRRELDEHAVARADMIVVDSVEQAHDDAGELLSAVTVGLLDWSDVRGLDAVAEEGSSLTRRFGDITIFKALGVGLADVAVGVEVLRRARATGAGSPLPSAALLSNRQFLEHERSSS